MSADFEAATISYRATRDPYIPEPRAQCLQSVQLFCPKVGLAHTFYGIFIDEVAASSTSGVIQWYTYLIEVHVFEPLLHIHPVTTAVRFGGTGKNAVTVPAF